MENTEKNPEQSKVIEEMSKTIQKLTNDRYFRTAVNSVFDSQTVSNSVQQLKVWNNGEKRPQTNLGDQFIF